MNQLFLMLCRIRDDGIKEFFFDVFIRERGELELLRILLAGERPPIAVEILVFSDMNDACTQVDEEVFRRTREVAVA